jgi:carbon monoxide dehydrogenase subunit G
VIIDQEMKIAAPPERVWGFMLDIPSVARCVPGVVSVTDGGDGSYVGALKVKVGPIGATLEGRVRLVEADEEARRANMAVEAADKRLRSAVNARMSMQLAPMPDGGTLVQMHTDASVMGKLGEFGQAVMKRKANQIVEEFARNMTRELQSGAGPASPATGAATDAGAANGGASAGAGTSSLAGPSTGAPEALGE